MHTFLDEVKLQTPCSFLLLAASADTQAALVDAVSSLVIVLPIPPTRPAAPVTRMGFAMLIPPAIVNDPLQRSRLKIQVAFCLGVRHTSHLSPVVNRIRTTIPFQSTLN